MTTEEELAKVQQQLEEYVEDDTHCPFCLSKNFEAGEIDFAGGSLWHEITCNECGEMWYDVYQMVAVEYDYTDEQFEMHQFHVNKKDK